jgi:hypothetical protein
MRQKNCRRFVVVDVLLKSTLCRVDVLSCRRYVNQRFVIRRFVIRRFVNRRFVCAPTVQLEDTNILVDVSSGVFRPLVPAALRRPIFDAVHCLAHAGEMATRCMILSRYLWPGLPRVPGMRGGESDAAQQGRGTAHRRAAFTIFALAFRPGGTSAYFC